MIAKNGTPMVPEDDPGCYKWPTSVAYSATFYCVVIKCKQVGVACANFQFSSITMSEDVLKTSFGFT